MFHLGLGLGFVGMEVVGDGGIYDRSQGSESSVTRLPEVSFAF